MIEKNEFADADKCHEDDTEGDISEMDDIENDNAMDDTGDTDDIRAVSKAEAYDHFCCLFNLVGPSYNPIYKAVWYVVLGMCIIMGSAEKSIILIGKVHQDVRIPLCVVMRPGRGKQSIVTVLEILAKALGLKYDRTTSYHPEQLVGKVKERKENKEIWYETIYGYLYNHLFIMDDALAFFEKKYYDEAARYLSKACDPIPTNIIGKAGVDVPEGERLEYSSPCTMVLLFQPEPIDAKFVTTGFFRRPLIIFIEIPEEERERARKERFRSPGLNPESRGIVVKYLQKIVEGNHEWKLDEDVLDAITEYAGKLIKQGKQRGGNAAAFMDIFEFGTENYLLRFSVLQAASNFRSEVTLQDVKNAFEDLRVFLDMQLSYIETCVEGEIGPVIKVAKYAIKYLHHLLSKGCTSSVKSSISINEFWNVICELENNEITMRTAKKRYYQLIDQGLIDRYQKGAITRVWLTGKGIDVCRVTHVTQTNTNRERGE